MITVLIVNFRTRRGVGESPTPSASFRGSSRCWRQIPEAWPLSPCSLVKSAMKSPINLPKRNLPGSSLASFIRQGLAGEVVVWTFAWAAAVNALLASWATYLLGSWLAPVTLTAVLGPTAIYGYIRARRMEARIPAALLGRDGEVAVGNLLEELRDDGAQVFHDLQGDGFNLDHVVIHRSGVYVIETKTYSKPDSGKPVLVFDGQQVLLNGRPLKTNAVTQARAGAHWLKNMVERSTGRGFVVRPVVVYVGWFIQQTADAQNSDAWVLNPKALRGFLRHSKTQLTPENIKLAAFHIERMM